MSLNKSKGNMYDFVSHTFNTVKGECPHFCTYCYMRRWGKQNPVRFDEKELKTDLGKGNFIFVGSSCDMWAKEIPSNWIAKTIEHCNKFDNHYLFQTKNPRRILDTWLPDKAVVCTTIETNRNYKAIMGNTPEPYDRSIAMNQLSDYVETYVTIEPIMDFDMDDMLQLIINCNPIQVNIGADSGNNKLPEPSKEKVLALIAELEKFTVVHGKKNLKRLLK